MGRKPEVFVRSVSMVEGQRLQRIGRTAKNPVKLRRAIVVLMSAQGQPAADIAHLLKVSVEIRTELEDPPLRLQDQSCMTGTSRRCE
jgi:hypothetical protein